MATALIVQEIQGRGRALVAGQQLRGGQIVLRESPLLIYAESEAAALGCFCAHCTRIISANGVVCSTCSCVRFCSQDCHNAAGTSSHTDWVCGSLSRLVQVKMPHDIETQGRFLIAAINLRSKNVEAFNKLMDLDGQPNFELLGEVNSCLSEFICSALGATDISRDMVLALLEKDKRNAFGLMAPTLQSGERKVRAYALYAQASFFNHDCLPNACRFDYIDHVGGGNTDIYIRLMHDVDKGTEICLSYFPVNLNYHERQTRLVQEYGFECNCERCKVEEQWGETMDEDDEGGEGEGEGEGDGDGDGEGGDGDFPHAMFFLKYMCPVEGCGGTMAPLPADRSETMECNMCGKLRSLEEFMHDLNEV